MSSYKLLPLSMMIAATLSQTAYAEQADTPITLDNVIVTSPEPLPNSKSHVRQDAIKAMQSRTNDTASLLRGVPGVSLYGSGGVSSLPVIRGLADDRLRVKVDGMDLISACANHMNPPLSYMSTDRVNELKVYPGIAPVSVGGDSIGGTILAESSKPEFANNADDILTKGEIGAFYRSNGDARGASLSASMATESFSIKYDGSTSKANNYDAGDDFKAAGNTAVDGNYLQADEVGSTSYETRNHALDLGLKLNEDHLLQLRFAHQDIPFQGWPNQRMDMVYNRSNQLNVTYNGDFGWGSLQSSIYREKTHHKMQFGEDKQFLYGTALGMPMRTEGDNRGLNLKAEITASDRDLFRIGAMMQRYRLDDYWEPSGGMMMAPNTFLNINNGERDRYGLFAEWEATWNHQWITLAGIRHETVKMDADEVEGYNGMYQADADAFNNSDRSHTDNNLDLTLLAKLTYSPTQTYEFGYAQKTRSPNLYERYAWSTVGMAMRMVNLNGDGNGYVGNVDLDPEVAHTVSFTADWHDAQQQDWNVTVTPYISYVDDFIDAERCDNGGGMMTSCTAANLTRNDDFVYLRYDNVSAKLYGLDISAQKHLYQSESLGSINGQAVISYVRGKNRDSGDDLYNIMPLNSTFTLHHNKGPWNNTVEWELVSAKHKVNDERNEQETAGYGLLHLRTSYQWKQARIDLGVDNVFDKFYSEPLGGAYTGQGATMSAAGVPWGITVPGMGRSFYTGISYQF